jgi:ankyrin repeat protein
MREVAVSFAFAGECHWFIYCELMISESDSERCKKFKAHREVHEAFVRADLERLKVALGNPADFPNGLMPFDLAVGDHCLEYAIYWSPLSFIRTLLELGADPNYDHTGFPSLIAAQERHHDDKHETMKLLLHFGADTGQRGINDWTPLHYAVAKRDLQAIQLLLEASADPNLATRIDACSTPLEDAKSIGFTEAVQLFANSTF